MNRLKVVLNSMGITTVSVGDDTQRFSIGDSNVGADTLLQTARQKVLIRLQKHLQERRGYTRTFTGDTPVAHLKIAGLSIHHLTGALTEIGRAILDDDDFFIDSDEVSDRANGSMDGLADLTVKKLRDEFEFLL